MRVNDDELELSLNDGEKFRWFRHDLKDGVGFWLGAARISVEKFFLGFFV
jgi:hypothetical protein